MDLIILVCAALFIATIILIAMGNRPDDYPEDELTVSETYEEERVITTIKKEEEKEEKKEEKKEPSPWDRPWEKK